MRRACARSPAAGDTAATMAMWPLRARCAATSARRRMLSRRSSGENSRSLLSPARSVSPASRMAEPPRLNSLRSSARASVDLPAPGRPVNHTTAPEWGWRSTRSCGCRADSTCTISTGTARCPASMLSTRPPPAMRPLTSITRRPLRRLSAYGSAPAARARDRGAGYAGEFAGIDRLFDGDHGGAAFHRADAHENGVAGLQRRFMQPKDAGVQTARFGRRGGRLRDDVAALKEELAVERDADRAARALRAVHGGIRPAFDGPDFGNLSRRHDDALGARRETPGLDAARDDAAVVEFVERLHRQA